MDAANHHHAVLIEFSDRSGLRQVSSLRSAEIVQKSGKALRDAMDLIVEVAEHVHGAVDKMNEPPSKINVGFGIKFDAEASALIAKAQTEASVTVTMEWNSAVKP